MNPRYERYMAGTCHYIGHIIKPGRRIAVFDRAKRRRKMVAALRLKGMRAPQIARHLGISQAAGALLYEKCWIETKSRLLMLEIFHRP